MKRFFLTIATAAMLITACGNQKPEGKQNILHKTASNKSDMQATDVKNSELLTKAQFIVKVWDYTKSPNDWKYLGNKPAIIDFYADWCGPCKIASPILEEIGAEYAGKVQVYKINAIDLVQRRVPGSRLITAIVGPVGETATGQVNPTRGGEISKSNQAENRHNHKAKDEIAIVI
jgi:thiol-disulfide isomerase/thioredoxin